MSLLDDKSAGIQYLKGIISPKFVVRRVIDGMQGLSTNLLLLIFYILHYSKK